MILDIDKNIEDRIDFQAEQERAYTDFLEKWSEVEKPLKQHVRVFEWNVRIEKFAIGWVPSQYHKSLLNYIDIFPDRIVTSAITTNRYNERDSLRKVVDNYRRAGKLRDDEFIKFELTIY